ncbi:AAA family ATPase [Vreelandella sp.]|uniref:AAA family ATPase n=1 Tax=Vreelandella sp. TaxID=3137778 RepID=UPI003BAC02DC
MTYFINGIKHEYIYNEKINQIDSRTLISEDFKKSIFVEQPIPHGVRFNHTQKLSNIDEELREKITLRDFKTPSSLIYFLNKIYSDNRFNNLKEVTIKKENYYFILLEDDYYIREDYFSSGEYFITHLYKLFNKNSKLIVIDEIDISLDSSAQVNLINEVRKLCNEKQKNIVFTTHSLALIKTLFDDEIYYIDNSNGSVTIKNTSYNYVKSLLFGFTGWDKYILVEDKTLEKYITHILGDLFDFYKYKVIYIGGNSNVIDLLKRNKSDHIFSEPRNVIAVLDGDVKHTTRGIEGENVLFVPFESVEKDITEHYDQGKLKFTLTIHGEPNPKKRNKTIYKKIISERHMTELDIFNYLNDENKVQVNEFIAELGGFLTPN